MLELALALPATTKKRRGSRLDKDMLATGPHFGIFFWQYSNFNFSFMHTKPTKQRHHGTVFPTLRTNNSFKKKAVSDENTSLPEPLIHLDDTARIGFQ